LAEGVVYKTPSEKNSVIVVYEDGVMDYLSEGLYGGYIRRHDASYVQRGEPRVALFCFKREREEIKVEEDENKWHELLTRYAMLQQLNEALKKYGAPLPVYVDVITYHYQPVEVLLKNKRKDTASTT
jgi:hypothetical protein